MAEEERPHDRKRMKRMQTAASALVIWLLDKCILGEGDDFNIWNEECVLNGSCLMCEAELGRKGKE